MADLYSIKFRGQTIFSASDGEFKFKRGLRRRRVAVDDVIGGSAIKSGCLGSAQHTLTLEFATTTTNASLVEDQIYQTLQGIWDGKPGTLEVPDFVALSNCVVMDIDVSEQSRIGTVPTLPASQTIVTGVAVVATIQFEQT